MLLATFYLWFVVEVAEVARPSCQKPLAAYKKYDLGKSRKFWQYPPEQGHTQGGAETSALPAE